MNPRPKEEIFQYIRNSNMLKLQLPDEKSKDTYYRNFDGNMQTLISFERSGKTLQGFDSQFKIVIFHAFF